MEQRRRNRRGGFKLLLDQKLVISTDPFQLGPELVRAAGLFLSRCSRPIVSRVTATETATVERETEDQLFHRREGSGSLSTGQWRVQFKRDKRLPCQRCGGASKLICHACSGAGRLGKGGYHEKNPINSARLVGSKWTAMERTLGWRHFQVTDKRKTAGETFVCLNFAEMGL
ncbi:g5625 [Coccomyxa elongata]